MTTVQIPKLQNAQAESWIAIIEISNLIPDGWTLMGGQLVQLHCWERGFQPIRVTSDVDAVLDVIGKPDILVQFTQVLRKQGFSPLTSATGHQYIMEKEPSRNRYSFPKFHRKTCWFESRDNWWHNSRNSRRSTNSKF